MERNSVRPGLEASSSYGAVRPHRAPTVREGFLWTPRLNQAQFLPHGPSRSGLCDIWRSMSIRGPSKDISTSAEIWAMSSGQLTEPDEGNPQLSSSNSSEIGTATPVGRSRSEARQCRSSPGEKNLNHTGPEACPSVTVRGPGTDAFSRRKQTRSTVGMRLRSAVCL